MLSNALVKLVKYMLKYFKLLDSKSINCDVQYHYKPCVVFVLYLLPSHLLQDFLQFVSMYPGFVLQYPRLAQDGHHVFVSVHPVMCFVSVTCVD